MCDTLIVFYTTSANALDKNAGIKDQGGWPAAADDRRLNKGMSITLQVPDSIARSLRLPENQVEERLLCELALSLYAQGILSFGKAAELASLSRYEFGALLGRRGIPRHYGPDDLADDLNYGRGE